MAELCVAGTVVNQIHADLKSEKSERGGADKEDRRRELNFPDRQVRGPPPPGITGHPRKVGHPDPHSSGSPGFVSVPYLPSTVLGIRNRIRIQNRQNWPKNLKLTDLNLFRHAIVLTR
jgi:hypothetical protein